MLHSREVGVHEPIDAVGQAALLALVEGAAADCAGGDALLPADACQLVGFCFVLSSLLASFSFFLFPNPASRRGLFVLLLWGRSIWGRGRTRLDLGALLLVGKELAQLDLVLVVELLDVGLVDREVGHLCGGGLVFGEVNW